MNKCALEDEIKREYFKITFHMLQNGNFRQMSYVNNKYTHLEFNFYENVFTYPNASYRKLSVSSIQATLICFFIGFRLRGTDK